MKRRASQDQATPGQQRSTTISLPAPVGGLNTRDPLSNMDEMDAIVLNNWYPDGAKVSTRKGAANHLIGMAKPVKSLITYSNPTKTELFACTDDGIFDASVAGAVGTAKKALTNGYVQHVNYRTSAGSFLVIVNGTDEMVGYDGTTWLSINALSSPAITGVLSETLVHVNIFKNRLWFIEENEMSVWYMPVSSVGGAATEFPMGQVFPRGGYLMAMGTWTIDGGSGVDDLAVFASSEGEIAVYQGTDPSSPSTFSLVGVYYVGAPLGRRCFVKFGGDLLYLSKQGLYPLSKAFASASIDRSIALSNKIDPTFIDYADRYGDNVGWEMTIFPKAGFIIVNVPTEVGVTSEHLVVNLVSGSWSRFTGWNARCFALWDDRLFFGGETKVAECWTGTSDFGANIVAAAQSAYSYFGRMSQLKHFKLVRPILVVERFRVLNLGMAIEVDFNETSGLSSVQLGNNAISTFDTDDWDLAVWAAGKEVLRDWYTLAAPDGYAVSFEIRVSSNQTITDWAATDFVLQQGGVL